MLLIGIGGPFIGYRLAMSVARSSPPRPMTITLNHTIAPARSKEAAARFFAQIFGLDFDGTSGHYI